MSKRFVALLAFLAAAAWPYLGEFVRSLVYEQASRVIHLLVDNVSFDEWGALERFGPSAVLVVLGLYLFFRTKPAPPQIHGRIFPIDKGVYIGSVHADVDRLDTDLFVIIAFLAYNGTTRFVSIDRVQGFISCNGAQLPEPKLLSDRSPTENLAAASEFMFVIEQRIPRNIADEILIVLRDKNPKSRVMLDFSQFNIFAFFPPNAQDSVRLSLWNTCTIDEEGSPPRAMRATSVAVGMGESTGRLISLHKAAVRLYEAADRHGFLDLITSSTFTPDKQLSDVKMLLMVDDRIKLFGVRAPSTNIKLIPKDDLKGGETYPGENDTIAGPFTDDALYSRVSMLRWDFDLVLSDYVAANKKG